jgi:flagellar basal-body rod protein FlgG
MGGIIEIGSSIISRASERAEVSAQNIANATTPGFKSHRAFSDVIESDLAASQNIGNRIVRFDWAAGKLVQTGNPFDAALAGPGFFVVRSPLGLFYTRNGQFHRDSSGHLVTSTGLMLQSTSGDIAVSGGNIEISADGTVLDQGEPVARLMIVDVANVQDLRPVGNNLFEVPANGGHTVSNPQIRQRMIEASNVSTADEMLALMAALRSAESGQRVVQVYDDLMGRALTAFGQ